MVKQNIEKLKTRIVASEKVNNLKNISYSIFNPPEDPKALFTFGCQRSGTTLLQRLLNLSPKVKMYGEGEEPYFYPKSDPQLQFRLRSQDSIRNLLSTETTHYVSLKPIYDTQNMFKFLERFPGSKAYFIFRSYQDVTQSHLTYYKDIHCSGRDYIKPLFKRRKLNWMNEYFPDSLDRAVADIDFNSLTSEDAYALHWYARNAIFLELLKNNPDKSHLVQPVCYEELLSDPEYYGRQIYNFANLGFSSNWLSIIRSENLYKPLACEFSPAINKICDDLLFELKALTSYGLRSKTMLHSA